MNAGISLETRRLRTQQTGVFRHSSKLFKHSPAMPLNTRCRALLTAKPAREGFVSMCACTEPVRTGIGAVCVEYGRPKWRITMLNHTHTYLVPGTEECFLF